MRPLTCRELGTLAPGGEIATRGLVVGDREAGAGRGRLQFVPFEGELLEFSQTTAPTAFWLGDALCADGTTVAARCRRNKYHPNSVDWLALLRWDEHGVHLEAELECDWLYTFAVQGDTLATISSRGVQFFDREGGRWSCRQTLSYACGSARAALDSRYLVVSSATDFTVFARGPAGWEVSSRFQVGRAGQYPSYDLALSGDLLAIGSDPKEVLLYRLEPDGQWRQFQRLKGKCYGPLALCGQILVYRRSEELEMFHLDGLLAEECSRLAGRPIVRVVWASPPDKDKRHFLAELGSRWGLHTRVGRTWKWLEGTPQELQAHLPATASTAASLERAGPSLSENPPA